jgi:hypothetical protein
MKPSRSRYLAAVVALRAAVTVNEALVLKAEATRLQVEASDHWARLSSRTDQIGDTSRMPLLLLAQLRPVRERHCRRSGGVDAVDDRLQVTRVRLVWIGSIIVGLAGASLFIVTAL